MISQCPCEALLNNKVLVLVSRRLGEVKGWREREEGGKEQEERGTEDKLWRRNNGGVVIRRAKVRLQKEMKERSEGGH